MMARWYSRAVGEIVGRPCRLPIALPCHRPSPVTRHPSPICPLKPWRRRITLLLTLLAVLFSTVVSSLAADELKAILLLKSRKKLEVQLISRRNPEGESWVAVRMKDEEKVAEFATSEIRYIQFVVPFDRVKLDKLFARGKYRETARELKKFLSRTFPYMDVPNNVRSDVLWLLRCYYKAGMWEEVRKTSRLITRNVPSGAQREEAAVYNILALQEADRYMEATRELVALKPVSRFSKVAPMYWFARVRTALVAEKWAEARDYAERIVTFAPKQLDWLPVGLYFSAKFHVVNGQEAVARQIVEEMKIIDARSRWTRMARALLERDLHTWQVAADQSGQRHDGRYVGHPIRGTQGATPATGTCLELRGDEDRVHLPLAQEGSFSVALWFKTDAAAIGLLTVERGSEGEPGMDVFLQLGNACVLLPDGSTPRTRGLGLADENWHQLVLSCDAGRQVTLFVDGQQALAESDEGGSRSLRALRFGYADLGDEPSFRGLMDDLQVYDRALGGPDAGQLFNQGRAGKTAGGLAAHLTLDEPPVENILGQFETPMALEDEPDPADELAGEEAVEPVAEDVEEEPESPEVPSFSEAETQ